jgi:aminoglycoside phosphotransferase family enzyme
MIDCLEFDRERRLLDPLHEVAGLAMECGELGANWAGGRALRSYSVALGDPYRAEIADLYRAIAATFRAVAGFGHLEDPSVRDKAKYLDRGRRYLATAERCLS